jgi:PAS domain S-box-containing protein
MRKVDRRVLLYALAALAMIAALLLREAMDPLLGAQNPYHTLWLAVVFCAWYCGLGPSILAVLIGIAGVWYMLLPPYFSFVGKSRTEIFGVVGFLAGAAAIMALGESTRKLITRLKTTEEGLRQAHAELEGRVRDRTAALEKKTAEVVEQAALLDMAHDAIFVKAAEGKITYWNHGAERLYGWSREEALGRSTHELMQTEFPLPLTEIENRDTWEGELVHTRRDGSRIVVASRWTTLRDEHGRPAGWLEINTDITPRKRAEEAARGLSGRILTLQDDERRRIARELHDSLGQYLAALKIHLDILSADSGDSQPVVHECAQIVETCLRETRTLSHLLHPPLLDEAGLDSAARWYVEGFGRRSGIQVKLEMPPAFGRLRREVETALFRALQEGLTNVHRHANSSTVEVFFTRNDHSVSLWIKDDGRGIPAERLQLLLQGSAETGVGLAGMRERIRELGGVVRID